MRTDKQPDKVFVEECMSPVTIKRTQCPIFYPFLTIFPFYQQIIIKVCKINLHGNSSSGSCADTLDRRTDGQTEERTDMTKVTGFFRNYERLGYTLSVNSEVIKKLFVF